MSRILASTLALALSLPAFAGGRYISGARVKQTLRHETERRPRCSEKELLAGINARIAKETR